jgi:hypothetical protein
MGTHQTRRLPNGTGLSTANFGQKTKDVFLGLFPGPTLAVLASPRLRYFGPLALGSLGGAAATALPGPI